MRETQRDVILLIAGFTVWSLFFCLLYALQALGCAYDFGGAHRTLLIWTYVVSLICLTAIAVLTPTLSSRRDTALAKSALWANVAALASAALIFAPVTFASTCL